MPSVHQYNVFADYFQFIVQDEKSEDDFASIWTPDALDIALAAGKSAICPGTLRNVEVSVEVQILCSEFCIALSEVDHAVETSLDVPSGTVVVMGCTEYFPDAPRFNIQPGTYRALSVMTGVASIETGWEPGNDKYTVYMWPGELRQTRLLKRWKSDA